MRLNTKSRYAVMALADMASFRLNKPISLRDISLRQGISLQYLEQIFLKLKKHNLVRSIRGSNGGYVLSKNSNNIKMTNFFEILEGPLGLMDCYFESNCEQLNNCNIRVPINRINDNIRDMFNKLKLSDITN